jgi:NhaP-type Na+/H+ or K+/H+ antiporter
LVQRIFKARQRLDQSCAEQVIAGNGVIFVLLGQQLPGIISGASAAVRLTGRKGEFWLLPYVLSICAFLTAVRWAWALMTIRKQSFGRLTDMHDPLPAPHG